jgi:hypothetical protein
MAKNIYVDKASSIPEICITMHICRATLYRYIKEEKRE